MCFFVPKKPWLALRGYENHQLTVQYRTPMRPKKEDCFKRTIQLKVCVTVDERKKIREHFMQERFPTFSDFVRYHLLKKREIKIIEVSEDFRDVFRSLDYGLAKLGNNLNQIAHKMNAYNTYMLGPEDKETFRSCHDLLSQCLAALEKHLMYLNR
jgi:hypothetical protein